MNALKGAFFILGDSKSPEKAGSPLAQATTGRNTGDRKKPGTRSGADLDRKNRRHFFRASVSDILEHRAGGIGILADKTILTRPVDDIYTNADILDSFPILIF